MVRDWQVEQPRSKKPVSVSVGSGSAARDDLALLLHRGQNEGVTAHGGNFIVLCLISQNLIKNENCKMIYQQITNFFLIGSF